MKTEEIVSRFSVDKSCQVCHGTGFIPIPDYSLIGCLGLFNQAIAGEWCFSPKMLTYCPVCFANETPVNPKGKQYGNLFSHAAWAKSQHPDYMSLLRSCLRWHWRAYFSWEHTEDLINCYCGGDNETQR